jgi:hypothetical protein
MNGIQAGNFKIGTNKYVLLRALAYKQAQAK